MCYLIVCNENWVILYFIKIVYSEKTLYKNVHECFSYVFCKKVLQCVLLFDIIIVYRGGTKLIEFGPIGQGGLL